MGKIEPVTPPKTKYGELPPELQEPLLARSRMIHAKPGQMVIGEGTESTDVYFIVSGRVQISLFSAEGRETILREMVAGQLLGELAAIDDRPRSANVTAVDETTLAHVTGAEFRAFLLDLPQAAVWLARQLSALVRDLTDRTFELATMPVSVRLQSLVMRLAIEAGVENDQSLITNLPTHADIAARIGSNREAVTRGLGQLTRDGIISQTGRKMTVLSARRLRDLIASADR